MDGIAADPGAGRAGEGTPLLVFDGFSGPLERLLLLARAHAVDLARLSLHEVVDQLAAALQQTVPLGQKGDWVVMAAWLLLLRSNLLVPEDAPSPPAPEAEAEQRRGDTAALRAMQALAAWLDRQPHLGRDVFCRGQPEFLGPLIGTDDEIDVIELLWASLALFEDRREDDTTAVYRPQWLDLHSIPEARARILRLLAETPEGQPFERLLPEASGEAGAQTDTALRQRSAWTSTLIASLELAKQGDVALAQADIFSTIQVRPAAASPLA